MLPTNQCTQATYEFHTPTKLTKFSTLLLTGQSSSQKSVDLWGEFILEWLIFQKCLGKISGHMESLTEKISVY